MSWGARNRSDTRRPVAVFFREARPYQEGLVNLVDDRKHNVSRHPADSPTQRDARRWFAASITDMLS